MDMERYYTKLARLICRPPAERYANLTAFHRDISARYCAAVGQIGPQAASAASSDGRTLAQVVGHIMEWDRYLILSCGELLSGLPQGQLGRLTGFVDEDGSLQTFESIDQFNARQAQKQAGWAWERIQTAALDASRVLVTLFGTPGLMDLERLEAARPSTWQLPGDIAIPATSAWKLWGIVLEHESVEHAGDLRLDLTGLLD